LSILAPENGEEDTKIERHVLVFGILFCLSFWSFFIFLCMYLLDMSLLGSIGLGASIYVLNTLLHLTEIDET
jgi:hypothetical protein